ncbi:hypothetical protein [Streptomyces sp. rh34]|uniref:hypothetical protein n=1 Tax=Streptomyces sp. rh34 TaxID=2034272 RepID=UPI000BF03643|nr:hypothetical protein [Streptomyces sp. rh34]
MSRSKYTMLRKLTQPDVQTAEWMAQARTPGTRARIRRWSRLETVGAVLTVGGVHAITAGSLVTMAVAVWFEVADIDRIDVYFWLWGPVVVGFIGGMALGAVAERRRLTAVFADGHVSVGRIDEVITHPAEGEDLEWYEFVISADSPGEAPLRRRLNWHDGDDPSSWVERSIRFRHNTFDPQNVRDALFDGFPDHQAEGAGGAEA